MISTLQFRSVQAFLAHESGIWLDDDKGYLVESRLSPLAKEQECNVGQLLDRLPVLARGLKQRVVEALTTHETSFFRDRVAFDTLKNEVLPTLIQSRTVQRTLSLLCAGVASGQEAYSLAIMLHADFPATHPWVTRIYGTDLSQQMVQRAQVGEYSQLEVNRGLPAHHLYRYFRQQGRKWRIGDELRRGVLFLQQNLTQAWPPLPQMDLVLLRNVLIYFPRETKKLVLSRVRQLMKPDGVLLLGSQETTLGIDDNFIPLFAARAGCFKLRGT
jgi:chemotaxis protein methyltransferase CheR